MNEQPTESYAQRTRLLEEALARCVVWIKAQDIYDDQFDETTLWTDRLDEVQEVVELVDQATAALGMSDLSDLLGRAGLRRRAELRRLSSSDE